MLRVSKMADYAMLLMVRIYTKPSKKFSAHQLSNELHLGYASVNKLLKMLHKSDLLASQRGCQGGYSACRHTASITLSDIITAIEGPIVLTSCIDENNCSIENICGLKNRWQIVNKAISGVMDDITLQDMIDNSVANFMHITTKNLNVEERQYG